MHTLRGFFWPEDAILRKQRCLLSIALLLAYTLWFVLGGLLAAAPNDPSHQFLWGLFWIVGTISVLVLARLLKTRQRQSTW